MKGIIQNLKKTEVVRCSCIFTMLAIIILFDKVNVKAQTYDIKNKTSITSYEGKSIQFKLKGGKAKIKWDSSNPYIATVSKNGRVKLKNVGKVWIKATYKGKVFRKKIVICKPYIVSESCRLDIGETVQCKLVGGKATRWKSDREEIVSVEKNGLVTANKTGRAVVSAYIGNGKKYVLEFVVYNSQAEKGLINNKRLVSHRGYNVIAPENTMSAFRKSYEYGYKFIETDVTFTADGVPVLLHDDTINRTSNGSGKINSLTYDYVRNLDFGSWKSAEFQGEKIPSFDEFMEFCSTHDIHPYVELKSNITQERVYKLLDIADKYNMRENISWLSFSVSYLQYMKNADSKAELGLNVSGISENMYELIGSLKTLDNTPFLSIPSFCLDDNVIQRCEALNVPIGVWTCDSKEEILKLDPYVSIVTTNCVTVDR